MFSFQPHSVPTPSAQPQHHTTASTSRADVSSQRQLRLRQQYLPHVNYDTLTLMQCISSFFAPPPPLPTVRTVTRHGNYIQRCPVSSCTGCSSGRSSNCTRDPHGTRQLNHTTTILSITHRTLTHTPLHIHVHMTVFQYLSTMYHIHVYMFQCALSKVNLQFSVSELWIVLHVSLTEGPSNSEGLTFIPCLFNKRQYSFLYSGIT